MPFECCTCCKSAGDHPKHDLCMCGCACLNGGCQVATAQLLLFMGTMFSLAALGDCNFVTVAPGIDVSGSLEEDVLVKAIGLISFEHPDGTCYWYSDGDDHREQIVDYFDFLGGDWRVARVMGAVGAAGGGLLFLFSITLCCSSHLLAVRFFLAFLLTVVLSLFQCLTFLTFTSDLCQENECGFSRSAGWSVTAAACYAGSGLCHVFMSDYPGKRSRKAPADTRTTEQSLKKPVAMDEEQAAAESDESTLQDIEYTRNIEGPEVVPKAGPVRARDGQEDLEYGIIAAEDDVREYVGVDGASEDYGGRSTPTIDNKHGTSTEQFFEDEIVEESSDKVFEPEDEEFFEGEIGEESNGKVFVPETQKAFDSEAGSQATAVVGENGIEADQRVVAETNKTGAETIATEREANAQFVEQGQEFNMGADTAEGAEDDAIRTADQVQKSTTDGPS